MILQSDMPSDMAGSLAGFRLYPGHFDRPGQVELLAAVREALQTAPFFTPRMPKSGRLFSVRMSNCGPLGWVSDEGGYRYQPSHPETGRPWPPIPPALMALWSALARFRGPPEACLDQLLWRACKNGSASGSRRIGIRCAGHLDFARRFLFVSGRRTRAPRSYQVCPAKFR